MESSWGEWASGLSPAVRGKQSRYGESAPSSEHLMWHVWVDDPTQPGPELRSFSSFEGMRQCLIELTGEDVHTLPFYGCPLRFSEKLPHSQLSYLIVPGREELVPLFDLPQEVTPARDFFRGEVMSLHLPNEASYGDENVEGVADEDVGEDQ